ncbi:PE-PGRS family protein [Mycobacterium tuberculosis RGTB423]|nr:PE-PGRS family protein [Mycobacterium tuberculosis RGTB423]
MSFVIAAPETLVRAASDLANIGSTLGAANAAALGPTTELLAAGADEVSAAIASLFAAHGQAYQAVSAQMSAFHAQFVQTFTAGAGAYASAEAAAAAPLEGLLNIVNTPTQLLLGRPLIGKRRQRRTGDRASRRGRRAAVRQRRGRRVRGARPGRRPRWSRGAIRQRRGGWGRG